VPTASPPASQGKLGITGDADDPEGLVFTDGQGRRLASSGRPILPEEPLVDLAARLNLPTDGWVHATGERLDPRNVRFDEGAEPEADRTPDDVEADAVPLSRFFVYDDEGNLVGCPTFDDE